MAINKDYSLIGQDMWASAKVTDGRNDEGMPQTQYNSDDPNKHADVASLAYNVITIYPNEKTLFFESLGKDFKGERTDYSQGLSNLMNFGFSGVVQNAFTYTLTSNWTSTMADRMKIISFGAQGELAGIGELGAKYRSRKYWTNNGPITISPSVRVVDWDGSGVSILSALILASYATSIRTSDIMSEDMKNLLTKLYEEGKKFLIDKATDLVDGASESDAGKKSKTMFDTVLKEVIDAMGVDKETLNSFISEGKSLLDFIGTVASRNAEEYMDLFTDLFTIRESPPVLSVKWGKVFSHPDMILTNVTMTFSKEQTASGPLYVDFDLTLESRHIVSSLGDTGLHSFLSDAKRVSRV